MTITYKKLEALVISRSKIAKAILSKLSSADIVLLDEAHCIPLPEVIRIPADIEPQIPDGYPMLSKILSKYHDLNESIRDKINQMQEEGDKGHVGKHLSQMIRIRFPLKSKRLSVAWDELRNLAKQRKKFGVIETDILAIREIITLMGGDCFSITYAKENEHQDGKIYLTGNYWISQKSLSDFLIKHAPRATHIYVSGTLIEPHPDFFSDLSGKEVCESIFPDIRNTNDKMVVYFDTWKLNSHNFKKSFDRIIDRILEIIDFHAGKKVYAIASNAKYARTIDKQLKARLGRRAPKVDYYRSDRTIGVENNARICIAIGLAELPSNTYDHQASGQNKEDKWIDSQRLRL